MSDLGDKARKAFDEADDKAHELKGRAKQKIEDVKADTEARRPAEEDDNPSDPADAW